MLYQRPAIEDRLALEALLIAPISGGGGDFTQPVWRSATTGDDETGDAR